jgi:hypothetical protein
MQLLQEKYKVLRPAMQLAAAATKEPCTCQGKESSTQARLALQPGGVDRLTAAGRL